MNAIQTVQALIQITQQYAEVCTKMKVDDGAVRRSLDAGRALLAQLQAGEQAAPAVAQMLADDEAIGIVRGILNDNYTKPAPEDFKIVAAIQRAFAAKNGIALPAPLKGQKDA